MKNSARPFFVAYSRNAVGLCLALLMLSSASGQTDSKFICDVTLDQSGQFVGQLVDGAGAPIANGTVKIFAGTGTQSTDCLTDAAGSFRSPELQGGVHVIEVAGDSHMLRVWTANAAPPTAVGALLLVDESQGLARGQNCCCCSNNQCCCCEPAQRNPKTVRRALMGGRLISSIIMRVTDSSPIVGNTLRFAADRPLLTGSGIAAAIAVPIAVPVGIAIAKGKDPKDAS